MTLKHDRIIQLQYQISLLIHTLHLTVIPLILTTFYLKSLNNLNHIVLFESRQITHSHNPISLNSQINFVTTWTISLDIVGIVMILIMALSCFAIYLKWNQVLKTVSLLYLFYILLNM